MKENRMKKLLSLVLAALFAAQLFPALRLTAAALQKGDVSGDGQIKAEDARLCLRRAVGLETYAKGSEKYKACDYDGDGNVTAADARLILRAAVGLKDDAPAQQKFKVPMVVYSGKNGEITLTGYQTKFDAERQETVLLVTFSIFNKSYVPYDPCIDGITVNGLQISEPEVYGEQIHPNSRVQMQVMIPKRYFDISQAGNAVVDELLFHFNFFDISSRNWLEADVALYPTNKTPGASVRYLADSVKKYSSLKETAAFILGYQSGTYHWRTDSQGKHVDYIDAMFYFKNKSARDLYVSFENIRINGSIDFEYDVELFVYAGTAAEPEIYVDPNFFAWVDIPSVQTLTYTVVVFDAVTGNPLFENNYKTTWS